MSKFTKAALQRAQAKFDETGTSVTEWARDRGFTPSLVLDILAGNRVCKRGQSHRIAVLLGLKQGELTPLVSRPSAPRTHRKGATR